MSLPATSPSIGTGYYDGMFAYTGYSGTITVSVPTGVVSAYTSKVLHFQALNIPMSNPHLNCQKTLNMV